MKIVCKTMLRKWRGTCIRIRVDDPESMTWGIYNVTLAEGRPVCVIDWGDGTSTETTGGQNHHTYAQTGEYEVRISDDIGELRCLMRGGSTVYQLVYAPMIREFRTDAALLEKLSYDCFFRAVNLAALHCDGSGLREIAIRSFNYCTGLVGRLDLPGIENIGTDAFKESTGITELHFSRSAEEAISALPGFATAFGASNAVCVFDL